MRQLDIYIQKILNYAEDHIAVSIAAGAILLYLLYTKPKLVLALFLVALGAAGVMELFSMLDSTGLRHVK